MTKRRVLHLCLIAWLVASCANTETSILISARVFGTGPTVISTVTVHVIPTTCWDPDPGCDAAQTRAVPVHTSAERVHRTIAEINGEQPIRVAVHLRAPTPVMVHVVAVTESGATIYYATRCYDPQGVVRDEVLLVETDNVADVDGDGWPNAMYFDVQCRDPGGAGGAGVRCHAGLCPARISSDRNDTASPMPVDCAATGRMAGVCRYPGAATLCGDGIDQDCRWNGLPMGNRDEPCGDMDMDGWQACSPRELPTSGLCDCNDSNPMIHPRATGACAEMAGTGIDWACTGVIAYCDHDMDGFGVDTDCNDRDAFIHPGPITMEACDPVAGAAMCTQNHAPCRVNAMGGCACDGVDNNCNVLVDEHPSCRSPDLDGDGSNACDPGVTNCRNCDCNDCDSGIHPGARDFCGDGIDEDGDGVDELCLPGDVDRDGYRGGQDCNEGDPRVHLEAPENCLTMVSESCGTMSCPNSVDVDRDGFQSRPRMGTDCNDMDAMVNAWANHVPNTAPYQVTAFPFAHETCDGIDNDCNGINDEVLDPMNRTGCVTDPGCTGGSSRCVVDYAMSIHHCGRCRNECNPGATLVADRCSAGTCSCSANPAAGRPACSIGSTCCATDAMGRPFPHAGCFDTQTSTDNCGACGLTCNPATSDACAAGRCVCGATGAPCAAGRTCCGGACVDLGTDLNHCGACARACGAQTACGAGSCTCDSATHGDCNGDIGRRGGNGCETDLSNTTIHCGSCATSCLSQHVATGACAGAACSIGSCATLYADCDTNPINGCETDLRQLTTCGACGTTCMAMHANSQCVVAGTTASCGYGMCVATFGDCDGIASNGCETSLRVTATCGACTIDCTTRILNASGPSCTASGTCAYGACNSGFADCDGNVANGCEQAYDLTHCGGACTNCSTAILHATGPSCTAGGTCAYTACVSGYSDCDGNVANGCEQAWDATHCGGCTSCVGMVLNASGLSCTAAGTCNYGACVGSFSDCDGIRANGCEQAWAPLTCGPACTNCSTTVLNATGATCAAGGTCDYAACSGSFADCDANRANGCETAWSTMRCGGSCTDCAVTIRNATGAMCTAGGTCDYATCNSGFFDCDGIRANGCEQAQNTTHCGSCVANCSTLILRATGAFCSAGGTCDYATCNAGWVDCDGNRANGCEASQSATRCGTACVNCTTGFLNGTAACTAGACAIASCAPTYANCDGLVSNGCEQMTLATPADCCGVMCMAPRTCTVGSAILGWSCS